MAVSQLRVVAPAFASPPALLIGPLTLVDPSSSSSSLAPDAASKLKAVAEGPEITFDLQVVDTVSEKTTTPVAKLTTVGTGKDFLAEYGLVAAGKNPADVKLAVVKPTSGSIRFRFYIYIFNEFVRSFIRSFVRSKPSQANSSRI